VPCDCPLLSLTPDKKDALNCCHGTTALTITGSAAFAHGVNLELLKLGPICRLKYTGDINNWSFAIFKYSDERYDSDEWFFPGSGHVDGTIEGAMKAGLEAYP
jgi:hypothetical protein